jgi:ribosome-associated protein
VEAEIKVMEKIIIDPSEIKLTFIPSPGPGGQNVNKVATAVLLRFNVVNSQSFTEGVRSRLLLLLSKKITSQGDLIIKAYRFRTQKLNKQDALERLEKLLTKAATPQKKRTKTKPTRASVERRLTAKKMQSSVKTSRQTKPRLNEF